MPLLLEQLSRHGLGPEDVDQIIITHVHLDHAGATGRLARLCPNATVLAHPRAAPHLLDPSKLIAGVKVVYGEEQYEALYGDIEPVPEERLRIVQDQEWSEFGSSKGGFTHTSAAWRLAVSAVLPPPPEDSLTPFRHNFGKWVSHDLISAARLLGTCSDPNGPRRLQFLEALGHARHHHVIWDPLSKSVFAGDAFGIDYSRVLGSLLHQPREDDLWSSFPLFMVPSTTPIDFEADKAHEAGLSFFVRLDGRS